MTSGLDLPSARRRAMYAFVGPCQRSLVITIRWRAALAWRSPPRFSRCRFVWPDDAGRGEEPQSMEKAESERRRGGGGAAVGSTTWPGRRRAQVLVRWALGKLRSASRTDSGAMTMRALMAFIA